jgi:diguanylate cyclase (GGDEF)-like protein
MNPPMPPLPQPNMFSLATMTIMIAITFIMQASLIVFSSRVIKSYKGVSEAAIATFSLGFSFLALSLASEPNLVIGYFSNLLLICGYFLIYLAICRFTETAFNRILVYGVLPLGTFTMTAAFILSWQWLPLIVIAYIIGIAFNISAAWMLHRSNHRRYKLSAYLTAVPLLIYGLVMVGRLAAGIIFPNEMRPGPSLYGRFDTLSLFVISFLWTSGFILMISQRLQSDLNDLAMNDALTRVRNRRAMQQMLDFEMRRVHQEVKQFSIILLDVDHFKNVNDTYGHDVGDIVLRWLASTLQKNMRVQDVVARWGGEEFLILLPDTPLDEATQIADRLRSSVASTPVETPSGTLKITFSAGISCSSSSQDVNELCKIADLALYAAKETRNKVVSQEALSSIQEN